jgi:ABC-2 type transport system permease protein
MEKASAWAKYYGARLLLPWEEAAVVKTFYVLANEIRMTLSRRSYVLVSFGIPLIAILLYAGIRTLAGGELTANLPSPSASAELAVEGYVDQAGLIQTIPAEIPSGNLEPFSSEEQAKRALQAGEISAYYLIPADYLDSGELVYVRGGNATLAMEGRDWVMRKTLLFNLTGGDARLTARVWNPGNVQATDLSAVQANPNSIAQGCPAPGYGCESNLLLRYLPLVVMLILFMSILMTASQLLHGLSTEKETRVMEVMIVSASPLQIMAGKILGLGILGLMQIGVWLGSAYLLVVTGDQTFNLPAGFTFPPQILLWGMAFFLLGYALYASLMAGAGALVPDLKSYSSVSMLVSLPVFAGYMVTLFNGDNPNGLLATVLSIFPLTSPVVMVWRITQLGVPDWQPALAAGLLGITAVFTLRAVARMFRAQELVSGEAFHIGRFLRLLVRPEADYQTPR